MEYPLVSIVVVSYNHAIYIREILDSIKAQTYPNIELIVADDASSDNSVEIFEDWLEENNYPAQKNFHSQNTGLATMLNECIELINGKYVKLIAADDFLHPQSIEKCVAEISKNPNFGFVFSDTYFIDKNSNILERDLFDRKLYEYPVEKLKDILFERNFIPAPSSLISYEALTSTGKYNPSKIVEDYDRWLRIISAGYDFTLINEKLSYYRSHGENISIVSNNKMCEEVYILNFKYSNKKYSLNKEIEFFFLRSNYQYSKEFFDAYKKYKYKDIFSYFFIKNNQRFLLKVHRIIKQVFKI